MNPLRFRPSLSTVLAGLALFFALGGSAFAVGDRVLGGLAATKAQQRCATGAVKGIAVVTNVNVPGQFTSNPAAFARRFNCTGQGAQVRKVATGVFDVRFPGLRVQSAVGAALSHNAGSVSLEIQPDGSFRAIVRSVGTEANVLPTVDQGFAIIVF
jgi:hypothetical protein